MNIIDLVNMDSEVRNMQSPDVKCNVTECTYNEQAKICNQTSIQVTKHQSQATSTEATDCGTFKLR